MIGGEPLEDYPLEVWNTAFTPIMKRLWTQPKPGCDNPRAYGVDEGTVSVNSHKPDYKRVVDSVNPESLIDALVPLPAWLDAMTISERINVHMKKAGLTPAEFARALGISPQRLHNYLTKNRPPDKVTLAKMATVLKTDAASLTGINDDMLDALEPILLRLFELEGMDQTRARVLASTAAEALRLQTALEGEGDARMRARMAAQAAWLTKSAPEQD